MELNSQTYYFKDLIEIRDNNLDLKSKKKWKNKSTRTYTNTNLYNSI